MNEQLAAGFDVLVWREDDGDVVCAGYTRDGVAWLKTSVALYTHGMVVRILSSPDDFIRSIPKGLKVGRYTTDTKRVLPLQ